MKTLRNVKRVELVRIPVLVVCVIPSAFKCVEDVTMENAGKFESVKELKEAIERKKREEEERRKEEEERKRRAAEEERLRKEREEAERRRKEAEEAARRKAVISCKRDWDCIDKRVVESIEVSDGCCSVEGLTELDLRGFVNLRELKVGSGCFEYVDEVKLIGMRELESVVIGMNSFTQHKNSWGYGANRHFYLKNCPKLKSLKMGRYSFNDYKVCEIENVDALEVIEMGDLNKVSVNFDSASLELKSILIHRE